MRRRNEPASKAAGANTRLVQHAVEEALKRLLSPAIISAYDAGTVALK